MFFSSEHLRWGAWEALRVSYDTGQVLRKRRDRRHKPRRSRSPVGRTLVRVPLLKRAWDQSWSEWGPAGYAADHGNKEQG